MPRLNLEEKTLALNLCNPENPNVAEVSRIMSNQIGRKIYPDSVVRVWKRNDIEIFRWGKPPRIDDAELKRCFNAYFFQEKYISHAAKKTANDLGYKSYEAVLYRWRKMGLI